MVVISVTTKLLHQGDLIKHNQPIHEGVRYDCPQCDHSIYCPEVIPLLNTNNPNMKESGMNATSVTWYLY